MPKKRSFSVTFLLKKRAFWVILALFLSFFWLFAKSPAMAGAASDIITAVKRHPPGPDRMQKWAKLTSFTALFFFWLAAALQLKLDKLYGKLKRATLKLNLSALARNSKEAALPFFFAAAFLIKNLFVTYAALRGNISFSDFLLQKQAPFSIVWLLGPAFFIGCGLLQTKTRRLFFIIADLLLTVFFFVELSYLRAFSELPTPAAFSFLENLKGDNNTEAGINVFMLVQHYDFLLLANLPLYALFRAKGRRQPVLAAFLLCGTLIGFGASYQSSEELAAQAHTKGYNTPYWLQQKSAAGAFVYNGLELYKQNNAGLNNKEKAQIAAWFAKRAIMDAPTGYDGLLQGKNLIFIPIESFESFVIGASVNGVEITPNINRLLKNALYFPNIYEQTTASSIHGLYAYNTGQYSPYYGVITTRFPHNDYSQSSFAWFFKQMGYAAYAGSSGKGNTWNEDTLFYQSGYDQADFVYRGYEPPASEEDASEWGLSDKAFYRQALPKIAQLPQPFAAYIYTSSSHTPFTDNQGGTRQDVIQGIENINLYNYLNICYYVDQAIGEMVDYLEKRDLLKNTVLALSGDHTGLSKFFPGSYPELAKLEGYNGPLTLGTQKTVPLLIYSQGLEARRFETIGSQADALPTLLSLWGEQSHKKQTTGLNLFALTQGGFALLPNGAFAGDPNEETKKFALEARRASDLMARTNSYRPESRVIEP